MTTSLHTSLSDGGEDGQKGYYFLEHVDDGYYPSLLIVRYRLSKVRINLYASGLIVSLTSVWAGKVMSGEVCRCKRQIG